MQREVTDLKAQVSADTSNSAREHGKGLGYERRILLLSLGASVPALSVMLILLLVGGYSSLVGWTIASLVILCWLCCLVSIRRSITRPLQTLSNLLAALREGDFSVRAWGVSRSDVLSVVMMEVNALGRILHEQRLGALEATALLRTVMAEIDVAVFAFDGDERLRLVNRAGESLLAQPASRLLGHSADELGLAKCLRGEGDSSPVTMQMSFPGGDGRWGLRRSAFRERGMPHQLLVLTDLSRPLREEELKAWQRLVRVLGHELNNSLAPIKSIAGTLASLIAKEPRPADWQEDAQSGLNVISTRAEALSRFIASYSKLARLPPPNLNTSDIDPLVRRVVSLESRLNVTLVSGPPLQARVDADQLEQLLINILRNGVDAALETGGGVEIGWRRNGSYLEIWVTDEGLGLANTANLFVPFFTTKPNGSGVGLVLSRQIAEAHGGTLTLENRTDRSGCEALLRLPL